MVGVMISAATGAMNSLLGKLATLMGEEFAKLKNLHNEVRFINEELGGMKDFLENLADVDKLDPQTKRWRDTVREMSYDIEDIIDDFMRQIGKKNENDDFAKKTVRLLRKLRACHQIASRIKEIKALVLETSARRKRYELHISPSSDVAIDPRVTTLYKNAASLVGVEGPANELVNCLTDEEKKLKVVSIVGFGGLGKTTLANTVYDRLKREFNCCAFVPVSQKPDIKILLRSLLSQIRSGQCFHDCELNVLLSILRKHLQNKRYLIIIDDIWDANSWDVIKCAFSENDLGSRVIVTTRIQDVAEACCSHSRDYIFKMKPLGDEDSRRLFFDRIFGSEEACPQQLKDVSVQIIKKCGGLPLAIISISGLLVRKGLNREEWEDVRNSLGSGRNLTLDGMRQILNLSYKNLPPHLKTCLLYLGMYPEDFTMDRSDLERQWMAEGFVGTEHGQDAEKVARNYFNELINRSLVQPVEFDIKGSVTQCKVHDMMLDLILLKSAEENFLAILDGPEAIKGLDYNKVRRLSIRLDGASNGRMLPGKISLSQVRSVMIFGTSEDMPPLSEFKFLRVLHVDLRSGKVDLTGLSKLYQLRYLKVSSFYDYELPTQIRGLQHLETLDVCHCGNVPSDIVHLARLLFLNLGYMAFVLSRSGKERHEPPDGIANMKPLRHLHKFDLGRNSIDNIEGLGELTNLRNLTVSHAIIYLGVDAEDRERRMDVLLSSLGKICSSLEGLYLYIEGCMDALMALSPPPRRLERLRLCWVSWFSRIPNWMGELRNLSELELVVRVLPKDGVGILAELPSLLDLDVGIKVPVIETIFIYERAFPVLKRFKLKLNNASYLSFQAGAMPMLRSLDLHFNRHGSEQKGDIPAGIEHLSALEEVCASIGSENPWESDHLTSVESALWSAIDMLPTHPRVKIELRDHTWIC